MIHDTADRILDFVRRFLAERGYAPSLREIAEGTDLASLNTVHHHLGQLVKAGRLRRTPGVARSIVLLEDRRCELCGRVTFPLCPDCGEAMGEMNEDRRREEAISVAGQEIPIVIDKDLSTINIEFYQDGILAGTIHNVGTEDDDDN